MKAKKSSLDPLKSHVANAPSRSRSRASKKKHGTGGDRSANLFTDQGSEEVTVLSVPEETSAEDVEVSTEPSKFTLGMIQLTIIIKQQWQKYLRPTMDLIGRTLGNVGSNMVAILLLLTPVLVMLGSILVGYHHLYRYKINLTLDLSWSNIGKYTDYSVNKNVDKSIAEIRQQLTVKNLIYDAIRSCTRYFIVSDKEIEMLASLISNTDILRLEHELIVNDGLLGKKMDVRLLLNPAVDLFIKGDMQQKQVVLNQSMVEILQILQKDHIIKAYMDDSIVENVSLTTLLLIIVLLIVITIILPLGLLFSVAFVPGISQRSDSWLYGVARDILRLLGRMPAVFYTGFILILLNYGVNNSNGHNMALLITLGLVAILGTTDKIVRHWYRLQPSFLEGLYTLGLSDLQIILGHLIPLSKWRLLELGFGLTGKIMTICVPILCFSGSLSNFSVAYDLVHSLGSGDGFYVAYSLTSKIFGLLVISSICFLLAMVCRARERHQSYESMGIFRRDLMNQAW